VHIIWCAPLFKKLVLESNGIASQQCVAVWCSVLQCAAVCCRVLQSVAVRCSVLQCVAVCWSVLQCAAVCRSVSQCVAVCSSVSQCVAVCCSVLQCVAVRCSVLQCVAVRCSVSQCVAVRCSALQCVPTLASQPFPHTNWQKSTSTVIKSKNIHLCVSIKKKRTLTTVCHEKRTLTTASHELASGLHAQIESKALLLLSSRNLCIDIFPYKIYVPLQQRADKFRTQMGEKHLYYS